MVLNHCNPLVACWIKCTGSSLQRDSCLVYFSKNPFDTFQLTGPVLVSGVDVDKTWNWKTTPRFSSRIAVPQRVFIFPTFRILAETSIYLLPLKSRRWTLASCAAGNSVLASSRPIVLQVVEKRILAVWTNGNDDFGPRLANKVTAAFRNTSAHQLPPASRFGLLLGDTNIDTEPLRFPSASDASPPRPSSGPCSPPSVGATEKPAELVLLVHDGLSVRYRFAGRRNERHVSWSTARTVAARPAQGAQMWAIVDGASQARSSSCCDRDLEDPLDEVNPTAFSYTRWRAPFSKSILSSLHSNAPIIKDGFEPRAACLDFHKEQLLPEMMHIDDVPLTLRPFIFSVSYICPSTLLYLLYRLRPPRVSPPSSSNQNVGQGPSSSDSCAPGPIDPHIPIFSVQRLAVPSIRPSPASAAASRTREAASLPLTAMTAASGSNNTGGRYRKRLPERPKPEPVMLDAAAARRSYVESLALRRRDASTAARRRADGDGPTAQICRVGAWNGRCGGMARFKPKGRAAASGDFEFDFARQTRCCGP
ncbi:hypothetical protein B0H11DRAFT_2222648 [Mycena galericulata]|nr:hypothetical protein B0H11DRAFT_2222648 [Mycena galericulata]